MSTCKLETSRTRPLYYKFTIIRKQVGKMASELESLLGIEMFIQEKVEVYRETHAKISEELKRLYPGLRGLSAMSVRRFCISHCIHKTARLDDYYVDRIVSVNIMKVKLFYHLKGTITRYFF